MHTKKSPQVSSQRIKKLGSILERVALANSWSSR